MTVIGKVQIGQVVRSKCGRDTGKYFVVVGKENQFVLLADGDIRKAEAPKKKNSKHIQITNFCMPAAAFTDADKKTLFNSEIRRSLMEITEKIDRDRRRR